MNDSSTRSYLQGDEEDLVRLLEIGYGAWPNFNLNCSPLEHWKWKYLDNPFKKNFIGIEIDNGNIIGTLHSFPVRIKIGDGALYCAYAADLVVHPDYRRMGVSKRVTEKSISLRKISGCKLTYFVTRNPIAIKNFSKIYSRFPFTITNLVRIRDINLHIQNMPLKNAWLIKLGYYIAKLANIIRNRTEPYQSKNCDIHISEMQRFDEAFTVFWKQISSHYSFIVERSLEYLNWRYCDPRSGDFLIKKAVDPEDNVLGYIVYMTNRLREDYPIGYIVDLLTLPDRFDTADILITEAIRHFDKHDVNIVNYLIEKKNPYMGILGRHGFLDSRINLEVFFGEYEKVEVLKNLERHSPTNIHFSFGDIDSLPSSLA